jgi:hypothetical protein
MSVEVPSSLYIAIASAATDTAFNTVLITVLLIRFTGIDCPSTIVPPFTVTRLVPVLSWFKTSSTIAVKAFDVTISVAIINTSHYSYLRNTGGATSHRRLQTNGKHRNPSPDKRVVRQLDHKIGGQKNGDR